jgi:RNA polymerase sigma-70 factor (ECF subfamily)
MKYKDDIAIVNQILSGNKKALYAFYKTYSPKLFSYIKSKVSRIEDAEEILQDSLLASLDAIRDYSGQSSLYTYIYSIAKHKVVDHYRRKKIKQIVFSKFPQVSQLVSLLASPEQKFDQKILKEKITRCFNLIKPKYQEVLKSKYQEDMTVGEIAAKTKETIKSVESTLFRARKAFIKVYANN